MSRVGESAPQAGRRPRPGPAGRRPSPRRSARARPERDRAGSANGRIGRRSPPLRQVVQRPRELLCGDLRLGALHQRPPLRLLLRAQPVPVLALERRAAAQVGSRSDKQNLRTSSSRDIHHARQIVAVVRQHLPLLPGVPLVVLRADRPVEDVAHLASELRPCAAGLFEPRISRAIAL